MQAATLSTIETPAGLAGTWVETKATVAQLRDLQRPDGALADAAGAGRAARLLDRLLSVLPALAVSFPHQAGYISALKADLVRWQAEGFGKPDFGPSLATFTPQLWRHDGLRTFALFPMYKPNGSPEYRFDVVVFEVNWPGWLAAVAAERYAENAKFVPAALVDHTAGYGGECAVLFPETVSAAGRPSNEFGIIFCDREANRFRRVVGAAVRLLRLETTPPLAAILAEPELAEQTFALWDLIHDTSHNRGYLPFDPFMVRQKQPYWMYALEELRADLRSIIETAELAGIVRIARHVGCCVLLDRILRFPVTGDRVRNYDGLAGQLLFAALHAQRVVLWQDNRLQVDWAGVVPAAAALHSEIEDIYHQGQLRSKVAHWSAAHDLISRYLTPNVASQWMATRRKFGCEDDPKSLTAFVHDDEFPLGLFHAWLRGRL